MEVLYHVLMLLVEASFCFHSHKIYVKHYEQLLYALLAVLQLGSYCVIFKARWLLNVLRLHHTNYYISHFRWPPWKLLPKVYMSEITFKMLMKWRIFTLFTYSNTKNCQSTKSGSTVYIPRLTIQRFAWKIIPIICQQLGSVFSQLLTFIL